MRTLEDVNKMFAIDHLPPDLQTVSGAFRHLAVIMFTELEPCAETTLALRKLWEAKSYAVWVAANAARK